jgi:peptide/nickel transport system substrate-binding protein
LTLNLRNAPFDDVTFRQQLAQAIDRDDLIKRVLPGQVTRIDTPTMPGLWAYSPTAVWYIPSKERVAKALDTLGFVMGSDGVRVRGAQRLDFELLVDGAPDRNLAAADIVTQLGVVGIKVNVTQLNGDELQKRLETGKFDMALHGWQHLGSDPDVYELWHSSQIGIGRNYAGLQDSIIDDSLSLARIDTNIENRMQLYAEFQQRWIDLVPSIIMYQPMEVYATTRDLGGTAISRRSDIPGTINLMIGRESRFRNIVHWFVARSREISGDLQP